MRKLFSSPIFFALALLLCATFAHSQGAISTGNPVVVNGVGQPMAGVTVAVCNSNPGANPTVLCSGANLATLYTDVTLAHACTGILTALNNQNNPSTTSGCSNPGLSDGFGNVVAFSTSGTYWCEYTGSNIVGIAVTMCPFSGGVAFASSFPGADIGAKVNAAIAVVGCGEIYIPAGSYTQSTPIVSPRCIKLRGASGYGTVLTYTGTSGCAITIADGQGTSIYPPAGAEDLKLIGPGTSSNTCGVYFGGSDGSSTAPSTSIDPAANYGDHTNINRLLITGFGVGTQYGYNTWRNTTFETVITSNGTGVSMPAAVANSALSGETITIDASTIQNNFGPGIFIGTGQQVNFVIVGTSIDINGCVPGPNCSWQIQNGTATSTVSISLVGSYIIAADHWISNYGYFDATDVYAAGGANSGTLGYLIDNENATHFTVTGGQWFNSGSGTVVNSSGQCTSWIAALITGTGANPSPYCNYIDRFGNANFFASITSPGGLNIGVVTVTGGAGATVYRCSVAGNDRLGVLTTVSTDCGTAVDTGLRVK